jgi:ABC-type polysaccharide/polyol phosphate export permease
VWLVIPNFIFSLAITKLAPGIVGRESGQSPVYVYSGLLIWQLNLLVFAQAYSYIQSHKYTLMIGGIRVPVVQLSLVAQGLFILSVQLPLLLIFTLIAENLSVPSFLGLLWSLITITAYQLVVLQFLVGISYVWPAFGESIGTFMQFAFIVTPVFWDKNLVSQEFRWLLEFNPLFWPIDGFREGFLQHNFTSTSQTKMIITVVLGLAIAGVFTHQIEKSVLKRL